MIRNHICPFFNFYKSIAYFANILDNIEQNISSGAADVHQASEQLTTAAAYQRRAGRRAACLLLILAVVAGVVLLAVSFYNANISFDTC